MNNKEILSQLGWSEDLISEFENVFHHLEVELPNVTEFQDEISHPSVLSGTGFDLFIEPVATESLFYTLQIKR